MRIDAAPRAALLVAVAAAALAAMPAGAGRAAAPGFALRIAAPERLAPGAPATIDVFVRLPPGPEQPLLLTPSSEGEALRVVRGRLLRTDARRTPDGELHFQVPVETRGEGTAVLRVHLLTYRCAGRCEAVQLDQSLALQVRAR